MQAIIIIDTFEDLVQCSKCKAFVEKNNWKWHKREHKYDEDGRFA